ncbi:MAG: hydrogenase expression/formation protein HypE [Planctomycetes bacterium]|jgi:hydrogenase expression/formation protein HypE|nr:hydrogenase expression/formation protein HypE [Planctomycetota bacterium]
MNSPSRDRILLAHGGGGQLMDELLREVVLPRLGNRWLDDLGDAALLPRPAGEIAFTTDGFVVQPLFFPGGDIGRLAVCGTVNDLAVMGADPLWLSLGMVLEEGLLIETLARILDSAAAAAAEAGVAVVTGDTKVVAKGQADGLYLTTAGIGALRADRPRGVQEIRPGDALLLSGTVADHGLSVMLQRTPGVASALESDVAPLGGLVRALLEAVTGDVLFLRDPTRGGLAGVAADLAARTGLRLTLFEPAIPVRREVRYAADLLGLDPLSVANEGKVVAVVRPDAANRALAALRAHPFGRAASLAGRFGAERDGLCELETFSGGRRIVSKPYGEDLPRIC